MATLVTTFGSLDLSEEIETWMENGSSRVNAQTVPRRHGLYIADATVLEGRLIRASGSIVKDSVDAAETRMNAIANGLNQGIQTLYRHSDRFYLAQKRGWEPKLREGAAGLVWDFLVEWICADPFLYKASLDSVTGVTSGGALTLSPNNSGTAFVYPRFTVTASAGAPITTITLTNTTTGKSWTYAGTIATGNSLIVNPIDLTVKNNGTNDLTNFTGIHFWLNSGANTITYSGSDGTVLIEWRARWYQ